MNEKEIKELIKTNDNLSYIDRLKEIREHHLEQIRIIDAKINKCSAK